MHSLHPHSILEPGEKKGGAQPHTMGQAHRGPPPAPTGVLLCGSARQAFKGASWVGSYFVDLNVRHIEGPRPPAGVLLCGSACQALKGAP